MKLGLVLEGGASRGYFSVGVMDALMEQQIWADYVIGASAGIANGVSYVSRQPGRSLKIALQYLPTKQYMGKRHLLDPKNRCLYNLKFVFDEIPNRLLPFDYAAYAPHADQTVAVLTDMRTGQACYKTVPADDRTWQTLIASCALPLLFQPVGLDGGLYRDGGIVDPVPAERAMQDGCDRLIVVLTRERSYIKKEEKALELAALRYRRYPAFAAALRGRTRAYNENRAALFELEREGRAFLIAPQSTAGWHRTESDPVHLKQMYQQGYGETMAQMQALRAYLAE